MKKIKRNDIVKIKKYKGDEYNERGRVAKIIEVEGKELYHVCNMNMPFMGTVSDYFSREEIE